MISEQVNHNSHHHDNSDEQHHTQFHTTPPTDNHHGTQFNTLNATPSANDHHNDTNISANTKNHTDTKTTNRSKDPVNEKNEFEIFNDQININQIPIFTRLQLSQYNGIIRPQIYVGIRGYIYDVSNNEKSYGVGKSYHVLVGKDSSRILALNKLNLKVTSERTEGGLIYDYIFNENTWYTGDLSEKQNLTVDKWVIFFRKRYRIVGLVVDHTIGSHD